MIKVDSSDCLHGALRALGLMIPISVQDVKEAYLAKAKLVHPDAGGDSNSFKRLQAAYERALAYAQRHSIRWIGQAVERYSSQQQVVKQIEQLGGHAQVKPRQWLVREIGDDFAHLFDRVVGIRLQGPHVSDAALTELIQWQHVLGSVRWIDLTGSNVTYNGLTILHRLPRLEWLKLHGVALSWWKRLRLRRMLPGVTLAFAPHRPDKVTSSVARHTVLRGVVRQ